MLSSQTMRSVVTVILELSPENKFKAKILEQSLKNKSETGGKKAGHSL